MPKTLLRAFSTRRREIEAHLERMGESSARAAQVATLVTRQRKEPVLEPAADGSPGAGLRHRWLERAAELGFAELATGRTVLDPLLGRARGEAPTKRSWPSSVIAWSAPMA